MSDVNSRVVEVLRAGGRGSGYAVAVDLVLTAEHVLGGDDDVRIVAGPTELPGTVVWRDRSLDAALVRAPAGQWDGVATNWGTLSGVRAVACTATGFPRVQKTADGSRVEEAVAGFIMPGTGRRIGRYAINVTSALPYEPRPAASPWSGMSGAAVLTSDGRHVLGVLVEDPTGFEPSRLEAVPVAYLLNDPVFAGLVGAGPSALTGLPEHPFLRPMYELPPRAMTDIQMLLPRFGVVPYAARPAIDTALLEWADGTDPFSVALVVGAGGSGKTRLAAETCDRLRLAGWETGRVDDPAAVAVPELGERTLLVVDYAEHQDPDALRGLVTALAERPGTGRVRLLLLARHHHSWWDWVRPAVVAGTNRGDALVLDLADLPFDRAGRAAYAAAATRTFADRLTLPVPAPPDVDSAEYDSPLLVQIAALLAVRGEAVGEPIPGRLNTRLLTTLLAREQRQWYRGFPAGDAAPQHLRLTRLPERAVLVTLLASPTPAQLPGLLHLIDELSDARNERLAVIAAWLTGVFAPGDRSLVGGRLDRLGPDPLIDWFLAQSPDLATVAQSLLALPEIDADRLARLINVVRLAAEQHATAQSVLVDLLVANLVRLVKQAVDSGEHQLVGALNAAVVLCTSYGHRLGDLVLTARAALDAVDDTNPLLGALGISLSELVVRGYRRLTETDLARVDLFRAAFAGSLLTLAISRANAGEGERALPDAEEAVRILRDVAREEPAYRVALAKGLNNLGACLMGRGQHADAAAALQEAAGLFRDDAMVGMALSNLGACYLALDRVTEAADVASRAVGLFDGLPDERRDHYAWELRSALVNLARCHDQLRDERSAVAAAGRAVALARSLVVVDRHRYLPDLVQTLIAQSSVQSPAAAIGAAAEAVRLCGQPAPGQDPRLVRLQAHAFTTLGDAQIRLGRHPEALRNYRQSVTAYRRIAEADAGEQEQLAVGLLMTAVLLRERGDPTAAYDAGSEAVTLFDAAVKRKPGGSAELAAQAHAVLGEILLDMGRPRDAIRHLEGAARAAKQATREERLSNLAGAFHKLGVCWTRIGQPAQAFPFLFQAVALYRTLTAKDERRHLRHLATTLHSLGACWLRVDAPSAAIEPTEEAIRLHRDANQHESPNPAALADCLGNLALCYVLLDDGTKATPITRDAVAAYRKLAAADPDRWRGPLAGKLCNLSSCLRMVGDPAGALIAATEAVQLARRLSTRHFHRAEHTLAGALTNLGASRADLGMVAPALTAAREGGQILWRLFNAEPEAYLPDLLSSVELQASLYTAAGRPTEALNVALELGQRLVRLDPTARRFPARCTMVFELIGDKYADLAEPAASATWLRRAAQLHLAGSRHRPDAAVRDDLGRLADKLDAVGRSGVAASVRRLVP